MPSDTALTPKGPLTGIRVIELGQIAASPFAAFCRFCHPVVKIECHDIVPTLANAANVFDLDADWRDDYSVCTKR